MKASQFELKSGDYTHRGALIMNPANSNESEEYYESDDVQGQMAHALGELQDILDAYESDTLVNWLADNYMETRGAMTDGHGETRGFEIVVGLGGPNTFVMFDASSGITVTSAWGTDTIIVILRSEHARTIARVLNEYVSA